jgi:hypothetical protein
MDHPILAILLAATGDGFASIPTLIKAWKAPETETASTYIAGFISMLLVIPSVQSWDIPNSAFLIYLLLINLLLVIFVCRRKVAYLFK